MADVAAFLSYSGPFLRTEAEFIAHGQGHAIASAGEDQREAAPRRASPATSKERDTQ